MTAGVRDPAATDNAVGYVIERLNGAGDVHAQLYPPGEWQPVVSDLRRRPGVLKVRPASFDVGRNGTIYKGPIQPTTLVSDLSLGASLRPTRCWLQSTAACAARVRP